MGTFRKAGLLMDYQVDMEDRAALGAALNALPLCEAAQPQSGAPRWERWNREQVSADASAFAAEIRTASGISGEARFLKARRGSLSGIPAPSLCPSLNGSLSARPSLICGDGGLGGGLGGGHRLSSADCAGMAAQLAWTPRLPSVCQFSPLLAWGDALTSRMNDGCSTRASTTLTSSCTEELGSRRSSSDSPPMCSP